MYFPLFFCKLITKYNKKKNINFFDVAISGLMDTDEITKENYDIMKAGIFDLIDKKIYDNLLNNEEYELYLIDYINRGNSFSFFTKIFYLYLALTYPNKIKTILNKIKLIGFVRNEEFHKEMLLEIFKKMKIYDIHHDLQLEETFIKYFEQNVKLQEEETYPYYIYRNDDTGRCVASNPILETKDIDRKTLKGEEITEECYIAQFLLYNFFINKLTMTKKEKNNYYKKYVKYKAKYMNIRSIFNTFRN
jgi:hypothetical protein